MYKTLRAVVFAAAPVLYGTGCEKNNGDPVVLSPLEQNVVLAQQSAPSAREEKLNVSNPHAAFQAYVVAHKVGDLDRIKELTTSQYWKKIQTDI